MALIDEQDLLAALSPVDGTLGVPAFNATLTVNTGLGAVTFNLTGIGQ